MARTATFTLDFSANGGQASTTACKPKACRRASPTSGGRRDELISAETGNPYLETASEFFKIGDMVQLTTGAVTAVLTADAEPMAGFANTAATGTAGAEIRIDPVNKDDVYVMNAYSATEASTDIASLEDIMGGIYDLAQATVTDQDDAVHYLTVVNVDGATLPRVKIVGVVKDADVASTATYRPVYVKFLETIPLATSLQGLQF